MLSTIAAAITIFLALVGVYGVLMTSVEQRRRELAIRAALGATPGAIVGRVAREGLTLTLAGVVVGMGASLQAGRFVTSLLFGVDPRDPMIMTVVPLIVVIASGTGWLAPARRASRADPAAALREC
jgi:putative ABC transport system permease protein